MTEFDVVCRVCEELDAACIAYKHLSHGAVSAIADCLPLVDRDTLFVKNYFLTTKNRKHFYLCLVRPEAHFRTSDISKQAGSSRLSFADEGLLPEKLHCYPGSVSPFGLLFDDGNTGLIVDTALKGAKKLAFHPCDNRHTLVLSAADFFGRYLPLVGREPIWVEVHDLEFNEG